MGVDNSQTVQTGAVHIPELRSFIKWTGAIKKQNKHIHLQHFKKELQLFFLHKLHIKRSFSPSKRTFQV